MTVPVHIRGQISDNEREHARATVTAVLGDHPQADHARIRLTGSARPGGPALIQINLRVCRAPARIQVAGPTVADTIATGAGRLHRQIRRLTIAWEPRPWPDPERRAISVPRHGDLARLKTVRLHVGMPCQATAVMNAMDYDVYLYTDTETGEDATVHRAGPTGYQLTRQHSTHPPSLPATLPLTINPGRPPRLTTAQAAQRLAEHRLPHLFFTDHDSRRGNLLYRRYDGHLGLITPVHEKPP